VGASVPLVLLILGAEDSAGQDAPPRQPAGRRRYMASAWRKRAL